MIDETLVHLGVALGCGLLIGVERERRKGTGPTRGVAGVRTFALAGLAGGVTQSLRQPLLVAAGALLVVVLAAIGYRAERGRRDEACDPGITTEIALFVTFILGVTAAERPVVAAATAVVVAVLLASRSRLHRFSTKLVTAEELRDGLLLAGAALVVLPLLPSRPIDWLAGVDPRRLWALVVVLLTLQAVGHVAVRVAGVRLGLPLSGLASGFVSSTATVAAMGARARQRRAELRACVAGSLFSSVATPVQLAIVAATVCPPALAVLAPALGSAALVAAAAGAWSLHAQPAREGTASPRSAAFSVSAALGFATLLTAVTAAVSLATARYGASAASAGAALVGFADVHAAAAAVLSLAAGQRIPTSAVLLPVLVAFTTNAVSKLVVARASGGGAYAARVAAGLVPSVAALWAPYVGALLRGSP